MEGLLEGGDEKRVDACGRKGGVAGKLVADVIAALEGSGFPPRFRARPLDGPQLAEFLAHTTKTGHSMHGIHLGVKEPHRRQFMHSSYHHC
jgi:hypothetical protein